MCSNSGRKEAFFFETEELLRRVDRLAALDFRAVVVTGGEPTIHPGFWEIVDALGRRGIAWDVNSHGRAFEDLDFALQAHDRGLERAIISLHSHEVAASCLISGQPERGHWETMSGIKNLLHTGVQVMVNCVLTTHNAGHLGAFFEACIASFGAGVEVKFAFPTTSGRGGAWPGIHLRYGAVAGALRAVRVRAGELGVRVHFESVPGCVLGDAALKNMGRSGFGETHYLEDVDGEEVFSIPYIETIFGVYPETCRDCCAFSICPGVSESYLARHGHEEFVPFVVPGAATSKNDQ